MSSRSQMETNSVATRRKNSTWGAFWNDAMWGLSAWEGRNYKHAIISYFKQKTDYIRKLPPLGRANCCFYDLRGIMKLKIGKLGRSEWVNVDWRTGNATELESCSVAQVSLKPGSSEFWDLGTHCYTWMVFPGPICHTHSSRTLSQWTGIFLSSLSIYVCSQLLTVDRCGVWVVCFLLS